MRSFDDIIELAQEYIPQEKLPLLNKAYQFALEKYEDIPDRLSGLPYITHPLEVAFILAGMHMDIHTLMAAILHRMLRDDNPRSTVAELSSMFGREVAIIVSGATKINEIQFKSRLDYKAENVKKLLIAMSRDIRILLLKMADHLHDMRTVAALRPQRRREMAQDTMDLYAPLASRLGIDWIKRELEDHSFEHLQPEAFKELTSKIEMSLQERQEFVEDIKELLEKKLEERGMLGVRILGRPKHLYSIYRKLIAQNIPVEKVYDKVAFRIILKSINECYEAIGIVHTLWQPIASRFKDFIGSPKANGYQSLHTSVVGPHGDFMEIQIRTEEMDEIANDGIAAHWAYKEGSSVSRKEARQFQWLKQMVQGLQEVEDSQEFLEAVKDELDHTEVYALTPHGDVKELPLGSSPLDFAYAIHTEVGHHCIGAKIEGKIVPLKYEIRSGDVIEILTSTNQTPNRRWLNLVKTRRAKNRIRLWLRQKEQARHLEEGREICDRELRKNNISLKKIIKTGHFKTILKSLSCGSLNDLLIKVGNNELAISSIIDQLQPPEVKEAKQQEQELLEQQKREVAKKKKQKKRSTGNLFKVAGIDDMLAKVSNCCMPMPGDDVTGFITAGRGVTVHKSDCQNLLSTDPRRHVDVQWNEYAETAEATHKSKIQVIVHDRKGMLVSVCNIISDDDADILDVEAHKTAGGNQGKIDLTVAVRDKNHLASMLNAIRKMDGVMLARRV